MAGQEGYCLHSAGPAPVVHIPLPRCGLSRAGQLATWSRQWGRAGRAGHSPGRLTHSSTPGRPPSPQPPLRLSGPPRWATLAQGRLSRQVWHGARRLAPGSPSLGKSASLPWMKGLPWALMAIGSAPSGSYRWFPNSTRAQLFVKEQVVRPHLILGTEPCL